MTLRDKLRAHLRELLREHGHRVPYLRGYEETHGTVLLESFGLDHPEFLHYMPSPWWVLRWLLRRSDVGPSDVFLEYGCGKGRVVLDAARRYPFKRVIGVDIAPDLTAVARELVERERHRLRCHDVAIETVDATEFQVPDDVTHVYLYNSFVGTTLQRVCQNLMDSLDRAPRSMRLIYLNPVEHHILISTGRFQCVRHARLPRFINHRNNRPKAVIYEAFI